MAQCRDLPDLDEHILAAPVRRALQDDTIRVTTWRCGRLQGSASQTTGGVYRISGTGRGPAGTVPWTVVLKILRVTDPIQPLSPLSSARREALAYRSGVLDA